MSSAGNFSTEGHTNALPPGMRLGEFEIRRVIGVGGFGIVYLAFDHGLEREVAIKEYMPSSLASRTATLHVSLTSPNNEETFKLGLRSFVNEAKMLARFDHRSLIKVHRFWEERGTAYMVMPLLRGRTLRDARRQMTAPPDEGWLRGVLDPVLGALEVLHREDVYHRDIAPDNILIGEDGVPMLLDFGAARHVIQGRSQTLTAILKPSYAPIEQYGEAANLRQGAWTDLYALGATFHYLLTEVPPQPATVRTVSDDAAPLAATPRPGVSEDFLRTVDWMLMPRPSDRPQSVAQLRDVLQGRAPVPGRKAAVPAAHWQRTESQAPAAPADDFELTRAVPRPTNPPTTPSVTPTAVAPTPVTPPPPPPPVPPRPAAAADDSWAAAPERVPPMAARARPGWVHWLAGGVAVAAGGAAVLFFLQRPATESDGPAAAASAVAPPIASAAAAVATTASGAAPAASVVPAEAPAVATEATSPPAAQGGAAGAGVVAATPPAPGTIPPAATATPTTPARPAAPTPAPALARTPAAQPAPKVSVDAAALRPAPAAAVAEPAARTPSTRPAPPSPAPGPDRRATVAPPSGDSPPPLRPPPETVTRPAAVERAPVERAAAERPSSDGALAPAAAGPRDPRDQCGGRMLLALHRCMVRECARPQFYDHPECVQVRAIEDRARTRISP